MSIMSINWRGSYDNRKEDGKDKSYKFNIKYYPMKSSYTFVNSLPFHLWRLSKRPSQTLSRRESQIASFWCTQNPAKIQPQFLSVNSPLCFLQNSQYQNPGLFFGQDRLCLYDSHNDFVQYIVTYHDFYSAFGYKESIFVYFMKNNQTID